ncbi:MAG TPA: 1-(5-phosphoribosyl)-5-[(5-phosphoribosylamino)methylideneamino]imidazole-4-carboxamide isomerase [Tahibacter sp.]|uniref:1-(5-phosphoribosyl)-5-[(5- phosphoribosylamino)methylideneamino]imidazole-4- carboxamide isomerase n=1 Tax=Tahibacter sp. TaxID=2056211 RepID=UPI002C6A70EA|nr:1-(5-phosphoribosyl)-5-[(5-phosphoribosylamino)methylideneamino]imidazole-4-carboxamide isomerase [Tahibacter sp.]HSX59122.1 1-(5-phosphoribosyl)-5-[(5-phosphoribosylamino)methylideneamino]imidazole-4-carboxamide isomerase [Tahibacter sp.]
MNFDIIPAIDLRAGNVVRLRQGDYSQQTSYRVDPLRLAQDYATAGAAWLHVVDLDGARAGNLENFRLIEALAGTAIQLQAGGGVRSEDDVQRLFDAGVARVVVGSVAVREPERVAEWLVRYGAGRLCIALDTRDENGVWRLPSDGWTQSEAPTLETLAPRYAAAGAVHVLCTDIHRDGMLAGPNLGLYAHLRRLAPGLRVQASGGVRDIADVRAVRELGVAGVVLGRSLLEGQLDLAEALAC